MRREKVTFCSSDGARFEGTLWVGEEAPRMVLYIVHGMTEHIARYEPLAEELTARGIAVGGVDLRGHGKNDLQTDCASFGADGWERSLDDLHLFLPSLKERFLDIPCFVLGFSLGSFLLRDYLGRYETDFAGAAIFGSGQQHAAILSMVRKIVKGQIKKAGFDASTPLIDQLSFENYNGKFGKNLPPFTWLCSDAVQLARYADDPLCKRHISAGLFYQLLDAMKRTGRKDSYCNWKKDMPVLLLSGAQDPVGDFGKGVKNIFDTMHKAGMQDVQMHLIPGARHDVFHEFACGGTEKMMEILIRWMEAKA